MNGNEDSASELDYIKGVETIRCFSYNFNTLMTKRETLELIDLTCKYHFRFNTLIQWFGKFFSMGYLPEANVLKLFKLLSLGRDSQHAEITRLKIIYRTIVI
ncbi:MAG: hypothetical protein D3924_07185 [Candidatus Electrothrix sp. AR4]|nr:hypothetical protein [Candidatus Electrothrix sp. AR4]